MMQFLRHISNDEPSCKNGPYFKNPKIHNLGQGQTIYRIKVGKNDFH